MIPRLSHWLYLSGNQLSTVYPQRKIEVHAFEGVGKGAIA
uniref:Uncharacterized protein n=1 Tax=Klebsiella pneumoniae TaxID=573 RepID=A0A8B0SUF4_KLEPN|nr:hypothetical protein [Klebsiella pneumoniae]